MSLRVLSPGPYTSIQDLGRIGYERYGVPQSGAMDWFALRAANQLVGNPPNTAALEFSLEAPVFVAEDDCLAAAAGRGYQLIVKDRQAGLWRAALVRRGEVIRFTNDGTPGWGYLAVSGGIDVPLVMGSRSTYLRGGFGGWHGRTLCEGDILPVGTPESIPQADRSLRLSKRRAGCWLPPEKRLDYGNEVTVPVIPGPQVEAFVRGALDTFLSEEYAISINSDRMGYRLTGPEIAHWGSADLLSEGLAWGSVQVPGDGMPMVMLSDRPTTGGYPKIATLTREGIALMAQAMPGRGRVRFRASSLEAAQNRLRELLGWIDTGIEGDEDEY